MTRWIGILMSTFIASSASATDVDEARRYFEAGKKAFTKTKYGAAIAAFDRAHRASPHPAILFSLAQAHRLRYFVARDEADLQRAVTLYNRYLAAAPSGRRREHAVEHLAAIVPIARTFSGARTGTVAARPARTRLMVQVNVDGAEVFLNDEAPVTAPLIDEVAPGRHKIRVTADGYFSQALTRTAAEGAIAVIDVELKAQPASLSVVGPDGADVYVAGEQRGVTPLRAPVSLVKGTHRVELIAAGHHACAREVALGNGETRTLRCELEATGARTASLWLFGAAGAVAAGSAVTAGLAFKAQSDALDIEAALERGDGLSAAQISDHQTNTKRRGLLRATAGGLLGGAVAAGVVGALLYLLDTPQAGVAPALLLDSQQASVGVIVATP